jgi:hypothetical protein
MGEAAALIYKQIGIEVIVIEDEAEPPPASAAPARMATHTASREYAFPLVGAESRSSSGGLLSLTGAPGVEVGSAAVLHPSQADRQAMRKQRKEEFDALMRSCAPTHVHSFFVCGGAFLTSLAWIFQGGRNSSPDRFASVCV